MNKSELASVFVLLASTLAVDGGARADNGLILQLNNRIEGLLGAERLSYSELNGGVTSALPANSDLDTESGTIIATGVSAAWQDRLWGVDGVRGAIDLHVANGDVTYNGYLQNLQSGALSPLKATTNETFIDLQPRVGKGFTLLSGNRDLLTPYASLGFTDWNRELTGPGGYTEQYHHYSWKLGWQYQIALLSNLAIGLDAAFGKTFNACMTSSTLSNTFDLGGSWIQSYGIDLRYMATRQVYAGLDTSWTHYGYGRSPAYNVSFNGQAGTVTEPTSKTVRDGASIVIGYVYR